MSFYFGIRRIFFIWEICFLLSWGQRRVWVSLHRLFLKELLFKTIDMPEWHILGQPALGPYTFLVYSGFWLLLAFLGLWQPLPLLHLLTILSVKVLPISLCLYFIRRLVMALRAYRDNPR